MTAEYPVPTDGYSPVTPRAPQGVEAHGSAGLSAPPAPAVSLPVALTTARAAGIAVYRKDGRIRLSWAERRQDEGEALLLALGSYKASLLAATDTLPPDIPPGMKAETGTGYDARSDGREWVGYAVARSELQSWHRRGARFALIGGRLFVFAVPGLISAGAARWYEDEGEATGTIVARSDLGLCCSCGRSTAAAPLPRRTYCAGCYRRLDMVADPVETVRGALLEAPRDGAVIPYTPANVTAPLSKPPWERGTG